jgi:hypothetical protein
MMVVERIHGYAVPYKQTAYIRDDDKLEQFDPGAFAEMLARSPRIEVRSGSHDDWAPKLAVHGLSFFEDAYGLGFSARVEMDWTFRAAITRKDKPMALVSLGGLLIEKARSQRLELGATEIISKATFDHITICSNAAYRGTAVWPDIPLDQAPAKIQRLSAQWDRGREAWQRQQAAEARMVAQLRPIGRTVGGHIVMMEPNGRLRLRDCKTGGIR